MLKVAFLIPSSGTAARGEAFNVLVGVENDALETSIRAIYKAFVNE